MALQFLKELCHNHRILSAGYADADFIPLRNELEIIDSLGKRGKDGFFEFFSETAFDFFSAFNFGRQLNFFQYISTVPAIEVCHGVAFFVQSFAKFPGNGAILAVKQIWFFLC